MKPALHAEPAVAVPNEALAEWVRENEARVDACFAAAAQRTLLEARATPTPFAITVALERQRRALAGWWPPNALKKLL